MKTKQLLAIDLGASSGRGIIAHYDNGKIELEEIHRFPHHYTLLNGRAYWDFLMLYENVVKCIEKGGQDLAGIGIDTWGVDFGLLGRDGHLLAMPRSYRDPGYNGANMQEAVRFLGGEEWLFENTGISSYGYNTLFQLYHMKKFGEPALEQAQTLLMLPNLLEYFLTGEKHNEYSAASTTQLYDGTKKEWALPVIEKLGIDPSIFVPVGYAGRFVGPLKPGVTGSSSAHTPLPVISVAGHDTASAIAAVPAPDDEYTFLSSGTWSLMGIASKEALSGTDIIRNHISNEGTWNGGFHPTINISGLWMIQECQRRWQEKGQDYSFAELADMAAKAKPLPCFIRPDDFVQGGDYPGMIRDFCRATGQYVPQTVGETVRCILDSLAMKYRQAYLSLKPYIHWEEKLYIVGGGTQNKLLNQLCANALGIPVIAGPVEATAIGNVLVQLEALGEIHGNQDKCEVISRSFKQQTYLPEDTDFWAEGYERFCKQILITQS